MQPYLVHRHIDAALVESLADVFRSEHMVFDHVLVGVSEAVRWAVVWAIDNEVTDTSELQSCANFVGELGGV